MSYFLLLDDQRRFIQVKFPESVEKLCLEVVEVKDYNEFVNVIERRGLPQIVSLDHDLSFEHLPFNDTIKYGNKIPYHTYKEKTGYDAAKYLINYCEENKKPLPTYYCHSMNPVGRKNILSLLNAYKEREAKSHGKN